MPELYIPALGTIDQEMLPVSVGASRPDSHAEGLQSAPRSTVLHEEWTLL